VEKKCPRIFDSCPRIKKKWALVEKKCPRIFESCPRIKKKWALVEKKCPLIFESCPRIKKKWAIGEEKCLPIFDDTYQKQRLTDFSISLLLMLACFYRHLFLLIPRSSQQVYISF
jgi:hypothetical protein